MFHLITVSGIKIALKYPCRFHFQHQTLMVSSGIGRFSLHETVTRNGLWCKMAQNKRLCFCGTFNPNNGNRSLRAIQRFARFFEWNVANWMY